MQRLLMILLVCVSTAAQAQKRVAVLPVQSSGLVTPAEKSFLTDLLRGIAGNELNAAGFIVMDRQNFEALLGETVSMENCIGSCAVDTGSKLQAHYVVSAKLTQVFGSYRLTLSAHDTKTRAQLRQVVIKIKTKPEFETRIEAEAPKVFTAIRTAGGSPLSGGVTLGGNAPSSVDFEVGGGVDEALIRFKSRPRGALVNIDGRALCETPCSKAVRKGIRQVTLTKLGFIGASKTLRVTSSTTERFKLQKDEGTLSLTSTPSGARVTIKGADGLVAGNHTTPLYLGVRPGLYTVTVGEARCTKPHTQRLRVQLGETTSAAFQPAELPAGLKVSVKDSDGNDLEGTLYANGRRLGSTLKTHKLPFCSANLKVKVAGKGEQAVKTKLLAQQVTRAELVFGAASYNAQNIEMVLIPAGRFMMGSPRSEKGRGSREELHSVILTHDFYLSKTEVTQAQYQNLMGRIPKYNKRCSACPVRRVSWVDAIKFANALSQKEGLPKCYGDEGDVIGAQTVYACKGYRLPTEAEWEYAARAGTKDARYGNVNDIAWHYGNSSRKTHPVAKKQPNRFGLYDMLGNVSEWCHDWFANYSGGPQRNPTGPPKGTSRVIRGGSYKSNPGFGHVRAAHREDYRYPRDSIGPDGIRLARSAP